MSDSSRCDTIDKTTRKDGQLFVPFLMFQPGDITKENPLGNLDVTNLALSLVLAPNLSEYSYTKKREENVGCGQPLDSGTEILSWGTTLGTELSSEYMSEEDGVVFKDFLYSSGDIIGTKTFTFGFDDGQVDMEGPVEQGLDGAWDARVGRGGEDDALWVLRVDTQLHLLSRLDLRAAEVVDQLARVHDVGRLPRQTLLYLEPQLPDAVQSRAFAPVGRFEREDAPCGGRAGGQELGRP